MKQESIDYLDKVACIASANIACHQIKPVSQRNDDEAGAALLMSAYLEMYEHWQNAKAGTCLLYTSDAADDAMNV